LYIIFIVDVCLSFSLSLFLFFFFFFLFFFKGDVNFITKDLQMSGYKAK